MDPPLLSNSAKQAEPIGDVAIRNSHVGAPARRRAGWDLAFRTAVKSCESDPSSSDRRSEMGFPARVVSQWEARV